MCADAFFNIYLCLYCMCYNITIKTCFISCNTYIDGKKNTKSCGFQIYENTVNKIVNTEKDNKESISEKL